MPHINLPRNRIFYFLVIGITILAIPLTVALVKQQQETRSRASGPTIGADTVALVNNEPISDSEYEKSKACLAEKNPNDPQVDNKALDVVIDEKVLSIWAQKDKVKITNKEVNDEAVRISGLNPSDCQKKLAKVNILRNRLSENLVKFREGKMIVINFGRYNLGPPYGQIADPIEREKLRQDEKAYADNLLNSITTDLKSKKISFDDAVKKVQGDKRVGIKSWYSSTLQSGPFTASDYIDKIGLLALPEVRKKIDALKTGNYSDPITMKISRSLTDSSAGDIEERYVIAKVEKIGKGFSGSKAQLLEKTRADHKTQILK